MNYNANYYEGNGQSGDRPALLMYERLWRRYLGSGPTLEFGGGVGYFAKRISRYTEVYGLETNEFALRQMAVNAPAVKPIRSLAEIDHNTLGSVTALHVFEHIQDDELHALGRELVSRLKNGGRILAVFPNKEGMASRLKGLNWSGFKDSTHVNLKSAREWRQLFESTWGLKICYSFADGYYDFPYQTSNLTARAADLLRAFRTLSQFLVSRPLLRSGDGENEVIIAEK